MSYDVDVEADDADTDADDVVTDDYYVVTDDVDVDADADDVDTVADDVVADGDDEDIHPSRNGLGRQEEREPSHNDKEAGRQVGLKM